MGTYGGSYGLALVLALLLPFPGRAAAQADEMPSVIVIFDGSGSMWGNIEGVRASKFAVARDGLRRGLSKMGPQTRVGLASFGHRRGGDCNDAEVMLTPEPLNVERILTPLENLNPRGRGPLTLALREAAKSLAAAPGKSSILLIHDNADNCQQNVCSAANELRAAKVKVHVVGLALGAEEANVMACLPQITGGRFFNTQSGEQVGTAIEEALRLVSSDVGIVAPAPLPAARSSVSSGPVPVVPHDAPAGLYLRAVLAPKTEPVGWPLHWIVVSEGAPGTILYDAQASNPYVSAAPGRYVVEVRDGAAFARAIVDVAEKGPTLVNLDLNASRLHVRGQAQKTGAPLGDAVITISNAGQKDAAGAPIGVFKGSEGVVTLPAGRYVVRLEQGLVRSERVIAVAAGKQEPIDINLNAALLLLTVAGRDGGPVEAPVFSVFEDDPDAPRGRREIARSAARQADFVLPPGTYYVTVRQGGAEAQERVAVGPGDVVRRTLSLAVGKLSLSTRPLGGAHAPAGPVSYRVERLDGAAPEVITTSRSSAVLSLAGGRYRVEGRYGVINARVVREVEIRPGQTQQLDFEHQAGMLKLRFVSKGGNPLAEVFWEIRDEAGRTVWTTGQPEPSLTLQAGRYQIRAETRDKRYDRSIELGRGDAQLVEVTAD